MAYVPGTEIEKPTIDLTAVTASIQKVFFVKKALRRAGVPENIITTFLQTVKGGFGPDFETLVAEYVNISS